MANTELQPLPLGTSSFAALRGRGQIYVDKTALIYELASKPEKFLFVRPRRFGKSLLISKFESLYKYGCEISRDWQLKSFGRKKKLTMWYGWIFPELSLEAM